MSKPQIQLDDGDKFSDTCIAQREEQLKTIAKYINADYDEIGKTLRKPPAFFYSF